jgi:hypothetical protein
MEKQNLANIPMFTQNRFDQKYFHENFLFLTPSDRIIKELGFEISFDNCFKIIMKIDLG